MLEEIVLPPGREHLESLAPTIQQLLARQGLALPEVEAFAAAIGPGSFSGIRIGLATVKGMALALGRPAVGVSSLEVLAWQALPIGETGIAVIDARRSQIYTAMYEKDEAGLRLMGGPALIQAAEIGRTVQWPGKEKVLVCGDTAAVETGIGSDPRFVSIPVPFPSPGALAELARQALRDGTCRDVHALAPLYIRRSDAEEKTRATAPAVSRG